jgi:hypothetical protein
MKAQSSVEIDVRNERTDKGDLHYPSRPFGVWHDTLDGPLPYLMDRHSHCGFSDFFAASARLCFQFFLQFYASKNLVGCFHAPGQSFARVR